MSNQSNRVGIIVLIGIVAIAATLIIRKNDKPKIEQPDHAANVVAADATGAITATLDGVVRGYDRDGNVKWTQQPVMGENAKGEKQARFANFFCAGTCPNAYGNSALAGENRILQFGFGSSGEGVPLGPPLNATDVVLRGSPTEDSLLVREKDGKKFSYVFVSPPKPGKPSIEQSKPVAIDTNSVVTALTSDDRKRVTTAVNLSSQSGEEVTMLDWYERDGDKWKSVGTPARGKLAGSCFSGDGERAAFGGPKTVLMDFGGGGQQVLPLTAQKVSCSFSPDGVTFSYSSQKETKPLVLAHFDNNGKRIWTRTIENANSFNAREGSSDLYQVTTTDGTLLLRAVNGATVSSSNGSAAAFPIRNGLFVTADEKGKPTWIGD